MGSEPRRSALAEAIRVADLGLRFVVTTVVGALGGFLLDRWLGWAKRFPVLTLVGFFLGLAGAMLLLWKELARRRGGGDRRG